MRKKISLMVVIVGVIYSGMAVGAMYYRSGYYVCYHKVKIYRKIYNPQEKTYVKTYRGLRYVKCDIYSKNCDFYRKYRYGWYPFYSQAQLGKYRCQHYTD